MATRLRAAAGASSGSSGRCAKTCRLVRLLAAMGFPGHLLERTYWFIEAARAARKHQLAAATGALEARI